MTDSQNVRDTLEGNEGYKSGFGDGSLASPPSRKLAVLTCMDARMPVEKILGLKNGEAHVIRNAGGRLDPGALRSLVISQRLLGTREVYVIHHTSCGMATFENNHLYEVVGKDLGDAARKECEKIDALTFKDLEESVRTDVQLIKDSPVLEKVPVHGFVYDVKTGSLNPVK